MEEPKTARLAEPDPAQRPARLAMYLGAGLIAAGAFVLYLGYDGAATIAHVPAQIPFLISGGLGGASLMVLGAIVLAVHVILRVQADFRNEIAGMRDALERVGDALNRQAHAAGAIEAAAPSANGTVMVARGSSSYHRPDCRLVDRAEHATPVAKEEAVKTGLVACRICKP